MLLEETECSWVSDQRSRPIALLNRVRQVMQPASYSLTLTLTLFPGPNPNPDPDPNPNPNPDPIPDPKPTSYPNPNPEPEPEQVMHRELQRGTLTPTMHYSIDMDLAKLYEIVTRCERLFSSPIPPNMARHGMRSLVLQLLLLPVVLAGTMPPLAVAATVAVTSYIYVGIDELGVQAEPPRSSRGAASLLTPS